MTESISTRHVGTEELECCKWHDTKGGLEEGGDDDEEAAAESGRVAHCEKQRHDCFRCGGPAQHHPLQSHLSLSLSEILSMFCFVLLLCVKRRKTLCVFVCITKQIQ